MYRRGGRNYVQKSMKRKRISVLLAIAWGLMVWGTDSIPAQAASQDKSMENLVPVRGTNSESAVYSSGVMLAGEHSFIITTGNIDWRQYQCIAIDGKSSIELEFLASGNGITLFEADGNYGGFSQNEFLSSKELSEGDQVFSYAYAVDDSSDDNIVFYSTRKTGYINGFHDDDGCIYVETGYEFDMTDFGGMVLSEEGLLAGVVVPIALEGSPCLFVSMDQFLPDSSGAEENPEAGGDRHTESENSDSGEKGEDEAPEEKDGGGDEGKESEKSGSGTPNLLEDSYFMRIALVVLAAMAGSMYVYMSRKTKDGGKTVYLDIQPSVGDQPVQTMLIGLEGYFQGRGFDLSEEVVIFGRNPACCTAVYPKDAKGISSLHCRIEIVNGKVLLTDLGSSYGTFLEDGRRLSANTPYELQRGNRFYLAGRTNMFQIQ